MSVLLTIKRWLGLANRPHITDRVRHKMTLRRGFVIGVATVKDSAKRKQRMVTVQYDDSTTMTQHDYEFDILPRWTRK